MTLFPWPGNVRELEHAIERACAMSSGPVLQMIDMPSQLQDFRLLGQKRDAEAAAEAGRAVPYAAVQLDASAAPIRSIAEMEKSAIMSTIQQLDGDKLLAAKLLGIGKTTLYRKLKEYGLGEEPPSGS
jgi:two-component system response regulator HydG